MKGEEETVNVDSGSVLPANNVSTNEVVSPLVSAGISPEEIEIAVKVIKFASNSDNAETYKTKEFRNFRLALQPLFKQQSERMYNGKGREVYKKELHAAREIASMKGRKKVLDKLFQQRTKLRAGRMARLSALQEDDSNVVPLLLDGAVDVGVSPGEFSLEEGKIAEAELYKHIDKETGLPILNHPASCYICKKRYFLLDSFYDKLCESCAKFNLMKRNQLANMTGRVALVTGCRVKIGYHVALKLLRAGASVVATTRFPVDAAKRFAKEPDFESWKSQLHIYGLDFRDIIALERFCSMMTTVYPRLDCIINNACQTIRRPVSYYSHLVKSEVQAMEHPESLDENLRGLVQFDSLFHQAKSAFLPMIPQDDGSTPAYAVPRIICDPFKQDVDQVRNALILASSRQHPLLDNVTPLLTYERPGTVSTLGISKETPVDETMDVPVDVPSTTLSVASVSSTSNLIPAQLSQVPLTSEDRLLSDPHEKARVMPAATDHNGQQVDLRERNSWVLRCHEVSTPEILESITINSTAPYILTARLKSLMERQFSADSGSQQQQQPQQQLVVGESALQEYQGVRVRDTNDGNVGLEGSAVMGLLAQNLMNRAGLSEVIKDASKPSDQEKETEEKATEADLPREQGSKSSRSRDGESETKGEGAPFKKARRNREVNGETVKQAVPPEKCRFIVQVSSCEGKFTRSKKVDHPHLNMAKASLNMLTRTIAADFVKSYIFVTSVDTGWINDEKPVKDALRTQVDNNFATPIDEIDAAARILDPIFAPLIEAQNGGECRPIYGAFLKDYFPTEW